MWTSYSYKLTACNPYNLYVLHLIDLIYLFIYFFTYNLKNAQFNPASNQGVIFF